jgi:hypothetical protein
MELTAVVNSKKADIEPIELRVADDRRRLTSLGADEQSIDEHSISLTNRRDNPTRNSHVNPHLGAACVVPISPCPRQPASFRGDRWS